ncbi:MAG: hypothetical protein ACI4R9_02325 [Kiritimatiellia bacterium]
MKRLCFFAAAALLWVPTVRAEVLMYEGIPVGDGAYPSKDADLRSTTVTDSRVFGFGSQTWGDIGTAVVCSRPNNGLSLPAAFSSLAAAAYVGEGSVGTSGTSATGDGRGQCKVLATDLLKRDSGKLCFRLLLQAPATTLEKLPAKSGGLVAQNYFAAGWLDASGWAYTTMHDTTTKQELAFAVYKDGSSVNHLALVLKGVSTSRVLVDLLDGEPVGGATYLCYAEVNIGAGTDGAETVRAMAWNVADEWDLSMSAMRDAGEAELIGDSVPTRLMFAGNHGLSSYADEFAVGTERTDVVVYNADLPTIKGCAIAKTDGIQTVTVSIEENAAVVKIVATDEDGQETELTGEGETAAGGTATISLASLPEGHTYLLKAVASNDAGTVARDSGSVYIGKILLEKIQDANEKGLVIAQIRISRALAASVPLTVSPVLASENGAEGVNWVKPAETVTIPAGEASAVFEVTPLIDVAKLEDVVVSVSLQDLDTVSDMSGTADFTIFNETMPTTYNIWVCGTTGDGLASTADNWSLGEVPNALNEASRVIVLDGDYSNVAMVYDGGVNDLADTVVSWTQKANYTNVVAVATVYPEIGGFNALTVEGDMSIAAGKLSQKSHGSSKTQQYCLKVVVNGNLTVGSAASIDVSGLGLFENSAVDPKLGAYGGDCGSGSTTKFTRFTTTYERNIPYGDLAAPVLNGRGIATGSDNSSKMSHGGGAAILEVKGDFVNNGSVLAAGEKQYSAFGSGGSIYIRAKTISGTGLYNVSVPGATKTDGIGGASSGGRIALYAEEGQTDLAALCQAYGLREGWGGMGGAGTVFVSSPFGAKLVVKNNRTFNNYQSYINYATTPIPAGSDTGDFNRGFRDVTLVASTNANVRLTRNVRFKALDVAAVETYVYGNSTYHVGAQVDLAGARLCVGKVIVDGVDLKLKPGDYTLADAKENGWNWLVDSSQEKLTVTIDESTSITDNSPDCELAGPGVLRIESKGLAVILR